MAAGAWYFVCLLVMSCLQTDIGPKGGRNNWHWKACLSCWYYESLVFQTVF